jgi:hypothetical protein
MPSLVELQRAMRADLLGPDTPGAQAPLASLILPAGLTTAQRLGVYRNNTLMSLTAALEETFTVVRRLVGDDFFVAAARTFIRRHPPQEPLLSRYGAEFAAFLAAFPPAQQLAYLPDVARLEWAVNEAFHAADAAALDPARLAGLPPEQSASLCLTLHPSCRLVASPYPVERIWRANQPDSDAAETIDLAAGACRLLVHRRDLDVRFATLSQGNFVLLAALAAGAPLEAAYGAAAVEEPAFYLAAALQRHLAAGVFVDARPWESAP